MPRIRAATVKEHRAAQRSHLLATARLILAEGGPQALKFGELAERAGLARPSVYEYFATRDELVTALMHEAFQGWYETLSKAVAGQRKPEAQIEALFVAHLRLVKRGKHGLQSLFGETELSARAQHDIATGHRRVASLLEPAIARLTRSDQELCIDLVLGALRAAMGQVTGGKSVARTAHAVTGFIVAGLRALD